MKTRLSRLLVGAMGLLMAAATLAPSIARADIKLTTIDANRSYVLFCYHFNPCKIDFCILRIIDKTGATASTSAFFQQNNPCPTAPAGSQVVGWAGFTAGVAGCSADGIGPASAGPAKLNGAYATTPDTLSDSLRVAITPTSGTVLTLGINGYAKHKNPADADQFRGAMSTLSVLVYPDSANAKAGTNVISTGIMRFGPGNQRIVFGNLWSPSDFTAITPFGDGNDSQVATNGVLTKPVTVPNSATAVVVVSVDPVIGASDRVLPASNPQWLGLLAALLIGSATWLLTKRRREELA